MILNLFFFNPGAIIASPASPQAPGKEILPLVIMPNWPESRGGHARCHFIADHIAIWDTVPSGLTHYAKRPAGTHHPARRAGGRHRAYWPDGDGVDVV